MPRFLVESYVTASSEAFADACDRARLTASATRGIRYVDSTYVPDDEIALHLFEAPSIGALDRAGRDAGLQFERIVLAVSDPVEARKETKR